MFSENLHDLRLRHARHVTIVHVKFSSLSYLCRLVIAAWILLTITIVSSGLFLLLHK